MYLHFRVHGWLLVSPGDKLLTTGLFVSNIVQHTGGITINCKGLVISISEFYFAETLVYYALKSSYCIGRQKGSTGIVIFAIVHFRTWLSIVLGD